MVTLRSAKPPCAGSIPAQDSPIVIGTCGARVVELVDTRDLKFRGRKAVRVQFPPRAQIKNPDYCLGFLFDLENHIYKN